MTQRVILAALLTFCLVGSTALAQAPDAAAGKRPFAKILRLVKFLNFEEAQIAQLKDLLKEQAEALKPLQERTKRINATLKELLASQDPNPAAVGKLVIARHRLALQMAKVKKDFWTKFEALLTPAQAAKLAEAKAKPKGNTP